jgi:thiol-disulfide isomerase/thioredoxin
MTQITRRALVAVAGTLAVAAPLRKLRAQELSGLDALHMLPAPKPVDIQFTTADGTARSVADYAGRGVVLNLWATWCVPCVREMPALALLARALAHDGVVVLPLSSDHAGAGGAEVFH